MNAPAQLDVFGCPLQGVRLIEASAGTGKTWNISGLYLRLLLERGLDVQQVLVVTFTNAATAELRERIRSRIAEVLARLEGQAVASGDTFTGELLATLRAKGATDEGMRAQLTKALRTFDEAAIFTIHGFCKRALDDAPFAAGLPLAQELIEDDGELRHEVANDIWRTHVAGADIPPAMADWLLRKREKPEQWAKLLRRHAGKPLSQVLWSDGLEEPVEVAVTAEFAAAFDRARALWLADRGEILSCVTDAIKRLSAVRYNDKSIAAAAAQWDAVFITDDPALCPRESDKLNLLTPGSLVPKKGQAPCEDHEFFRIAQQLVDGWSAQQEVLERARMRLLHQLVDQGPAQLRERKRSRRVVAFDDMLFNLYERLAHAGGAALAATLRRRFPAALIDEFQDTDPLQFSIFDRVYGASPESLLLLVGDPKQAIYSFRNADLHTYLQARGKAEAHYSLQHNQRSTPELLQALNALFGANRRAFLLEGLLYHPVDAGPKPRKLFVDATQPRAPLHLWNLPLTDSGLPPDKTTAREWAVRACAGEIARLLAAALRGELQHDARPLEAGEIAVLVRSHREGSDMRQALLALGIGSVELRQTSVFRTPDAQELEALLLAVADPAREPLVRAALATELLGLDAAAIDAMASDESALLECIERFTAYRDLWLRRGVAPMLRELMAREGIHMRMLQRADGERRLTNLRHLAEMLNEAAQDHAGADALLRWLRRQRRDAQSSDAAQVRLESDRNLVQIVTIHKSKGLEYPVVFCPFLWNGHGGVNDPLPGCEYHDDDGKPVVDYRDVRKDAAIQARIRSERDAERLRLIYVALTRAVHRCYLVVGGYTAKAGKSTSSKECTRNPLNWLVAGEGMAPEAWSTNELPVARIVEAWGELAQQAERVIAFEELPREPGRRVELPQPAPDSLAAREPPAAIPRGWRIGSYSALAHGVRRDSDAAAADRDLHAENRGSGAETVAPADDDILRFPRGARAGESLHAVFEHADFTDAASWPEQIVKSLRAKPPATGAVPQALAPMVNRMLADVLATPLDGGVLLRDVALPRRRAEFEFNLSAPSLDTARIAAVMRRHGYADPRLGRQSLQGYLRGFIDLVFEQGGRFHIVDWKSNYLGATQQDYAGPRVRQAMDAEGYHLQYLLYAVAVHRWLQRRLRGYDFEQNFGGVHYLFVRGVRPAWRDADGRQLGVFHARPTLALIEELDAEIGRAHEVAA